MIRFIFVLCVAAIYPTCCQGGQNIQIDELKFLPQSDENWYKSGTLHAVKLEKNTYELNGDIELMKNLGKEEIAVIKIFKRNPMTGQFMTAPIYTMKSETCTVYEKFDIVDDVIAAAHTPPRGTCPLPKGKYTFNHYVVHPENFPQQIPPGEYKLNLSLMKDNKFLAGYDVVVTITRD